MPATWKTLKYRASTCSQCGQDLPQLAFHIVGVCGDSYMMYPLLLGAQYSICPKPKCSGLLACRRRPQQRQLLCAARCRPEHVRSCWAGDLTAPEAQPSSQGLLRLAHLEGPILNGLSNLAPQLSAQEPRKPESHLYQTPVRPKEPPRQGDAPKVPQPADAVLHGQEPEARCGAGSPAKLVSWGQGIAI